MLCLGGSGLRATGGLAGSGGPDYKSVGFNLFLTGCKKERLGNRL